MKKVWKFALLGAAVASLIPFKIERKENGDYDYRSLLFGISKNTDAQTGEPEISLSFFNLPEFKCDDDIFDDELDEDTITITEEAPSEQENAEA